MVYTPQKNKKKVTFFTSKKKKDLSKREYTYIRNFISTREMFSPKDEKDTKLINEISSFIIKIKIDREYLNIKNLDNKNASDLKVIPEKNIQMYESSIKKYNNLPNNWILTNENKFTKSKKNKKPHFQNTWKQFKVLCGHHGWVRCADVDISNEFFVTGSADRTIKIWDLKNFDLKLTLTGHTDHVRGVKLSKIHPYLFSVGLDQSVKCWDLEQNKIIRSYHGHLSGVFCLNVMKDFEIIITGGRDSVCRVWDIRTKKQVMVLSGHKNSISSIDSQTGEPQIITGSHDNTIRCWDLSTGRSTTVLTHHKKSIRSLLFHPKEYTFASGSGDNIKIWKCPEGNFLRNMESKPLSMVNTLALNQNNVLVAGHQTGHLTFWDWKSGICFQEIISIPQPGSIEAEAGIEECIFDQTGKLLITAETDKTIKIWKNDKTN